jgi:hypothetical protein
LAFYRKGGRILAAVSLNWGRDLRRSIPLIKAREPIEAAKLCDLDVDLRTLGSVQDNTSIKHHRSPAVA